MRLLVGVHHGRQQQRVEHRLAEHHAGGFFLHLQKFHVKRCVVRYQHRVLRKGMEHWQHGANAGLAVHHVLANAVDGNALRRNGAAGVHQLLIAFLAQQPAVDDAGGANLQDGVTVGRVQARGFGVEHGVGQV